MRIALLISGGGTTMEAIIKACQNGQLKNVVPALVISSDPNAGGIAKARALGIPEKDILVLNPKLFETREKFGEAVIAECKKRNVDFIGQYGWMIMTPKNVIDEFEGMIVNQHPGPLDTCPDGVARRAGRPDFGGAGMFGLRVHETRLEFVRRVNRDFWTEATTHRVTTEFDKGLVLKRKQVSILPNDTAETLQVRLLPIEHQVQIEALQDFANNTVSEFHRDTPLVLPGEESILEECKQNAIKKYPNG